MAAAGSEPPLRRRRRSSSARPVVFGQGLAWLEAQPRLVPPPLLALPGQVVQQILRTGEKEAIENFRRVSRAAQYEADEFVGPRIRQFYALMHALPMPPFRPVPLVPPPGIAVCEEELTWLGIVHHANGGVGYFDAGDFGGSVLIGADPGPKVHIAHYGRDLDSVLHNALSHFRFNRSGFYQPIDKIIILPIWHNRCLPAEKGRLRMLPGHRTTGYYESWYVPDAFLAPAIANPGRNNHEKWAQEPGLFQRFHYGLENKPPAFSNEYYILANDPVTNLPINFEALPGVWVIHNTPRDLYAIEQAMKIDDRRERLARGPEDIAFWRRPEDLLTSEESWQASEARKAAERSSSSSSSAYW